MHPFTGTSLSHMTCFSPLQRCSPVVRRLLFPAALFLLASCAPFSDKGRAAPLAPADVLSAQSIALAADAVWPAQQWWDIFGDGQLHHLITRAMRQSPTLHMAEARVRQAASAAQEAGAGRLPQGQGTFNAQRTHFTEEALKPATLAGKSAWDNSALLKASLTLDLWGRERNMHNAALSAAQAQAAEARTVELALQRSIVQTYIRLAERHRLLDVARETLRSRENVYRITGQLFQAGLSTELALSQAEATLPSIRARIIELESDIGTLRFQLALLCGEGPDSAADMAPPHLSCTDVPALPASLPVELVGRRPDIVVGRWRAEAAARRISAAKAEFFPNIDLSAAIGYISFGFSRFLTPSATNSQFGPAVTLPIFQGGRLLGQLQRRNAEYDEAVEAYNQSVLSAFSAVATCMNSMGALKNQAVEAERALLMTTRSYDIAGRAYAAGLTDYLGVLTAESSLLVEKERTISIRARQLSVLADLLCEMGGGYRAAGQEVAPPIAGASS